MITFWLICASFVAIALAFVLPPLLRRSTEKSSKQERRDANLAVYRDHLGELDADRRAGLLSEEQYEQDRIEIERRLLEEVSATESKGPESQQKFSGDWLVYGIALALPLLAVGLYLRIGNHTAVTATASTQSSIPSERSSTESFSQADIAANVAALAKRMEENPKDSQGWIMLGRAYSALGRYDEASRAYERALELVTDDADLVADYAFTLAMANNKSLAGRPTEMIQRALKLDSENPKALELAGSASFEAGDYRQALVHWEKLLARLPVDSDVRQSVLERIERAKSLAEGAK